MEYAIGVEIRCMALDIQIGGLSQTGAVLLRYDADAQVLKIDLYKSADGIYCARHMIAVEKPAATPAPSSSCSSSEQT